MLTGWIDRIEATCVVFVRPDESVLHVHLSVFPLPTQEGQHFRRGQRDPKAERRTRKAIQALIAQRSPLPQPSPTRPKRAMVPAQNTPASPRTSRGASQHTALTDNPPPQELVMQDEKRQRLARLLGWAAFGVVAFWAASFFQKRLGSEVQLQYLYKDAPALSQITRVMGEIWTKDKELQARVTFFHKQPPTHASRKRQTLKLPTGRHRILVTLWYKDGRRASLRQSLPVQGEGTLFVYLRNARFHTKP